MKNAFFISFAAMFIAAVPAQAQIIRRPFLYQVVHSPFVNQLVNFGLSQVLPGFPTIPIPRDNNSALLVDSAVKGNLDRTAKNLTDTDDIMKVLLDKYKTLPDKGSDKKSEPKTDDKRTTAVTDLESRLADLAKRFEAQTEELNVLKKTPLGTEGIDFEAVRKFFEKKAADDKKKVVNVVPILDEKLIAKKGNTPIKIELTEAAPEDLILKASAINIAALTGLGMIKKGEKSGVVTITTDNVPDGAIDVTIHIAATATTKAASLTIKTKVQAP